MELTKSITQVLKYGLRGTTTISIPLLTLPIFTPFSAAIGMSVILQCGLVVTIPLWVIWLQTVIAWVDDILRWTGVW